MAWPAMHHNPETGYFIRAIDESGEMLYSDYYGHKTEREAERHAEGIARGLNQNEYVVVVRLRPGHGIENRKRFDAKS